MAQELWKLQAVSHRDTTLESVNTSWKEPVYVKNYCCIDKFINVANTLCARDYKGFCKQGLNGVLECRILNQ